MRGHMVESVRGTTISFTLHLLVAWGAIVTTRQPDAPPAPAHRDTVVVFAGQPDPERPPFPPGPVDLGSVVELPDAPIRIPQIVPAIEEAFVIDSTWARGLSLPGIGTVQADTTAVNAVVVFAETSVDERPGLISTFNPVYPDLLRQAGIEGTVLIEVVVDTSGRAETGSIRVRYSTNRAFEYSAVEAVVKSRYRPGRVGGRPVRVLVQVPITFSIR